MPEEKILFTGDFFGPQFPNVFTMRGEKIRKPVEYIRSLNKIIALQPEVIAPAHFSPTHSKEEILANLIRTRDAVQYVHDATMEGMKAGKSLWQLMREIKLPPELDLANKQPVHALHLVKMALAADPAHRNALEVQLRSLRTLKEAAEAGVRNDYEIFWLRKQISDTELALGRPPGLADEYQSIDVTDMTSEP